MSCLRFYVLANTVCKVMNVWFTIKFIHTHTHTHKHTHTHTHHHHHHHTHTHTHSLSLSLSNSHKQTSSSSSSTSSLSSWTASSPVSDQSDGKATDLCRYAPEIKEGRRGLFHIVGSHPLVLPINVQMERGLSVHPHSHPTALGQVQQLLSHIGLGL